MIAAARDRPVVAASHHDVAARDAVTGYALSVGVNASATLRPLSRRRVRAGRPYRVRGCGWTYVERNGINNPVRVIELEEKRVERRIVPEERFCSICWDKWSRVHQCPVVSELLSKVAVL